VKLSFPTPVLTGSGLRVYLSLITCNPSGEAPRQEKWQSSEVNEESKERDSGQSDEKTTGSCLRTTAQVCTLTFLSRVNLYDALLHLTTWSCPATPTLSTTK
jgi:hypothetical protein